MIGEDGIVRRGLEDRSCQSLEHRDGAWGLQLMGFRPEDTIAPLRSGECRLVEDPRLAVARGRLQPHEGTATARGETQERVQEDELLGSPDETGFREGRANVAQSDHERRISFASLQTAPELQQILQDRGGGGVAVRRVLPQKSPDDLVEDPRRIDALGPDAG